MDRLTLIALATCAVVAFVLFAMRHRRRPPPSLPPDGPATGKVLRVDLQNRDSDPGE